VKQGWIGSWSPGIGDPSVGGWVTVVAYFAAAFLCFRAYRAELDSDSRSSRLFWLVLVSVLVLLGINKQLDLQSALTAIGRKLAHEQGWYAERRAVQHAFIVGVALCGLSGTAAVFGLAYRSLRALAVPLAGLGLLVTFVVVRAASFHHVDRWLGVPILGLRLNKLLELTSISIILVGALPYSGYWPKSGHWPTWGVWSRVRHRR